MNTEAKFEAIIEVAHAAGLHTVIHNNEVTAYLVSTADFNASKVRPPAVRATIRDNGRKTIAFTYMGVRSKTITRIEALQTLTDCID